MGRGGWLALSLAVLVLAGCGTDRTRPFEPLAAGPGGGGSDPPPSGSARVEVVSPGHGDTILRTTFTDPPGVEVVIRGEFAPGQSILLDGFANRYGPIPFHSEVYRVEERGIDRLARRFRAQVRHLEASERALLLVRVRNNRGAVLARDSVQIELR